MIKLYAAFTKELDNTEKAVREIVEQLKPGETVLKNSVGIVHFYHEYTETGVYQALVDALPFELVGCVSTSICASGNYGDLALSVTLITSDDVFFTIRALRDLKKKSRAKITEELSLLFSELCESEKPKMVMTYLPVLKHFSGDYLVEIANMLPRRFPLFGTIAPIEDVHGNNFVVSGGEISSDIMVFVAFHGNTEPKFRVHTSFDFEVAFGDDAEITDADDSLLKAVNGMPAVDFLIKQGIITDRSVITGNTNVVSNIPVILTRKDGTKVVRGVLAISDENPDHVFLAGHLEIGSKISFTFFDSETVLQSSEKLMTDMFESGERNFIAYSCEARASTFGSQYLDEVKKIASLSDMYGKMNKPIEYCVSYSAGEICPVVNNSGEYVNTLHNYTLISCSFD